MLDKGHGLLYLLKYVINMRLSSLAVEGKIVDFYKLFESLVM